MRLRPWQRLRKRREFNRERGIGLRYECPPFLCRVLPPMDPTARPCRRLGVIASKRVGNAICRNRCKRLLREVFRLNQEALPEHCDVIFVARKDLLETPLAELEARFRDAAQRAVKRWARQKDSPPPSEA
ncbi:ribonuclease P protein component [Cerasicoccus maritimus]|uniref:ribonuclease P protein component n=1 Tax=Cerasicoccus maritimus TaxID=490089 RepID=UPI00285255FB|nr:ribonuclease P protein component [Cerasicoccus maritimus]